MAESSQAQASKSEPEPLVSPTTEKSCTLSPTTETNDGVNPAIETLSLEPSLTVVSGNGTPAIEPSTGESSMLDAPFVDIPGRATYARGAASSERSTDEIDDMNSTAPQILKANILKDRQNRLMAELVSRFSNLVKLATAPEEDGATLESQASLSLQMNVETTALVSPLCGKLGHIC